MVFFSLSSLYLVIGIELTSPFSIFLRESGVLKLDNDINSSNMVSSLVSSIALSGNVSIRLTYRLAVPDFIAEQIIYLQIIFPLSSSTSFQYILAPILSCTPTHRALNSFELPEKDGSVRSRR